MKIGSGINTGDTDSQCSFGNISEDENKSTSDSEIGSSASNQQFNNLSPSKRPASVLTNPRKATQDQKTEIGNESVGGSIVSGHPWTHVLPRDLIARIAAFLPAEATLQFGETCHTIRNKLRPYLNLLSARGRSRAASTLDDFNALLNEEALERPLPTRDGEIPACRGEVLAILGGRIPAMPEADQEQARQNFLLVAEQYQGKKPENFEPIVAAAKQGIEALKQSCFNRTVELCKAPTCSTPDSVLEIAAKNGIGSEADIARLMEAAAQSEVAREKNVTVVANTFGLSHDASARLQSFAFDCPHIRDELYAGTGYGQVAYRYGIDDPKVLTSMKLYQDLLTFAGH